jgi:hypothetical protein
MFLTKPQVIEDQGSLFSGGVPIVTVVHENPIYARSAARANRTWGYEPQVSQVGCDPEAILRARDRDSQSGKRTAALVQTTIFTLNTRQCKSSLDLLSIALHQG